MVACATELLAFDSAHRFHHGTEYFGIWALETRERLADAIPRLPEAAIHALAAVILEALPQTWGNATGVVNIGTYRCGRNGRARGLRPSTLTPGIS